MVQAKILQILTEILIQKAMQLFKTGLRFKLRLAPSDGQIGQLIGRLESFFNHACKVVAATKALGIKPRIAQASGQNRVPTRAADVARQRTGELASYSMPISIICHTGLRVECGD